MALQRAEDLIVRLLQENGAKLSRLEVLVDQQREQAQVEIRRLKEQVETLKQRHQWSSTRWWMIWTAIGVVVVVEVVTLALLVVIS